MYNKYQTVLVDADMDFILDDHYDWATEPGCHHNAQLDMSGWEYGAMLRRFLKPSTIVRVIVDHHESLYCWDKEEVRNALCIHIDAHHDMWKNDIRRDSKSNRRFVDCGSYLHQALCDGIVGRVVYVPSMWRWVKDEREDLDTELPSELRNKVGVRSYDYLLKKQRLMPKADILTLAISPGYMPQNYKSEIASAFRALGIIPQAIRGMLSMADRDWRQLYYTNWCRGFQFPYKGSSLRKAMKPLWGSNLRKATV